MGRTARTALLTLALLAWSAAPAAAGPPGKWTRVTGIGGVEAVNTDEIGLQRTPDGVLHVAWTRDPGPVEHLLHSEISANARNVSGPNLILKSQAGLNNSVDLVREFGPGGGLQVLFAGLFSGSPALDQVLATSTSDMNGSIWSSPEPFSNNTSGGRSPVYAASGIAAGTGVGGILGAWGDSSGGEGGYHFGQDPTQPDIHFPDVCCSIDPGVGIDSKTGTMMIARNDISGERAAVRITTFLGATLTAPKSGASSYQQRVAISGRIGRAGIFVAYGMGTNQFLGRPAWWQVGSKKFHYFASRRGAEHVGLAPAPGGRLWIYWDFGDRIEAVRTGRKGVSTGRIRRIRLPRGADTVSGIYAEGSRGPLDLLTLVDAPGGLGYFHQRIKPGLRVIAGRRRVRPGARVVFRVTDGDPVRGARVRVRLPTRVLRGRTNARGRVSIRIPAGAAVGRRRAVARKRGYARGAQRFVIIR